MKTIAMMVVLVLTLAGCGNGGLSWLATGLGIESVLDLEEDGADGEPGSDGSDGASGTDGLHCYDLNANGDCDEEEDWTGPDGVADGICDHLDCRGAAGLDGADGNDGDDGLPGVDGLPGPQGEPGETTVMPPVVIVVPPDEPEEEPGDEPPFGNAYGHDDEHGNGHHGQGNEHRP